MPPSGYDAIVELPLLALLGVIASAVTIVSGFGLNTVLVPAFAVLFPLPLAIAAVALVHLIASAIRLVIFRAHINREIALQFVPLAIFGGIAGALILELLGALPVIITYPLLGVTKSVTAVKVVVGVTIALLSLYELRRGDQQVGLSRVGIRVGALASGFFGGLSGNQGAIRSTVLIRAGLTPPSTSPDLLCMARLAASRASLLTLPFATPSPLQRSAPPLAHSLVGGSSLP
ncbi:MAG: hypothetical protein RI971_1055 [Chloroflexota bacterium]